MILEELKIRLKARIECIEDVISWIDKNPNSNLKELKEALKYDDSWCLR